MAAPPKPWELQRNSTVPVYDNQSRGNALASSAAAPTGDTTQIGNPRPTVGTANNPPTIPPRITTSRFGSGYGISPYRQMGGYGGYNNSYGYGSTGLGYGSTGLGYGSSGLGYGTTGLGYGSYGGYGSGYGSYGYGGNSFGYGGVGNDIESRFVQLAEESSRPAFQTIESVVRAFASISGMMDSTFFAITSSFRAILGVAENFGRLRTLFSQMWTSFAIFRMFNWILKKLLSLIGIRTAGANEAWSEAIGSQAVGQGAAVLNESRPSGWPVAMFLGVILSAPYVISRLFSNTIQETQNQPPPGYRKGKAIHNFVARSQNEISLSIGQIIWIAPSQIQINYNLQNTGWIFVQNSNGQSGVVPINHIAVYNQVPKNPVDPQPSTSKEENVEKPSDISNLEPSIN